MGGLLDQVQDLVGQSSVSEREGFGIRSGLQNQVLLGYFYTE